VDFLMSNADKESTGSGEAASRGERLQKVLARAGVASRRAAEELIRQGRVKLDGRVTTELGTRVDPVRQRIEVDGEPIRAERPVHYLLNKPQGFLCTDYDPSGRPRAIDLLGDVPQRLFCVGRLDRESEGLLLFTNDGQLAHRVAHPRFRIPKTYVIQVAGRPSGEELAKLRRGIYLSEGKVHADSIRKVAGHGQSTVLQIVLSEGRNREIRRMFARLGHKVMHLRRTRIGPLTDDRLKPGQYRKLRPDEVEALSRPARMRRPKPSTQPRRKR
jgi:23S rRNA pseudouridine2605 synthase